MMIARLGFLTVIAASIQMLGVAHAADMPTSTPPASTANETVVNEQINPEGAIKVGSMYLYPTVVTGFGYNDNVNGASSGGVDSVFYTVRPSALFEYTDDGDIYRMGYAGAYTRYTSSSADNFDTHELQAQASNAYTARASSLVKIGSLWSADARGSTDRASGSEPDRYRQHSLNGVFAYGAKEATGRLEGEMGYRNKRYINNRSATVGSDVDTFDMAGRFYYRLAPKTRSFLELRNTVIDYKLSSSTQDGTERRAMLGVDWEATASTTGIFKVGVLNKKFDSASRKDFTGLSWEGTVKWEPLSYTSYDLNTYRTTADSTGSGDYMVVSGIGLDWNHKWNDRISSKVGYSYSQTNYRGYDRSDDTDTFNARLTYQFRRWVDISANYSYVSNDSNVAGENYRKNIYMLMAGFKL